MLPCGHTCPEVCHEVRVPEEGWQEPPTGKEGGAGGGGGLASVLATLNPKP